MSGQNGQPRWAPSPELLAAYADGELAEDGPGAALFERVEAWLAIHPDAAEEVETQRCLSESCRARAADDPGEEAWTPVVARLQRLYFSRPRPRKRWAWLALLGASAVACALLALAWNGRQTREPVNPPQIVATPETEDTVLLVATAAEVEILSVQGADTGSLVVGELPVDGSLVLLDADELLLTRVEPDRDDMVPGVLQEGSAPLIWAPTDAERESQKN
jgi:anti-sigma factor RsiW